MSRMRLLIDIEIPFFDCIYRNPSGIKRTLCINVTFQTLQMLLYVLIAYAFTDDDFGNFEIIQKAIENRSELTS